MHNHKILYLLGLFILYMQEWALKPFGTFPPDYNLVVSLLYILLGFWWYRDEKLCSFSQFGATEFKLIIAGIALSMIPAWLYHGQDFVQSLITYRLQLYWLIIPLLFKVAPSEDELMKFFKYGSGLLIAVYFLKLIDLSLFVIDDHLQDRLLGGEEKYTVVGYWIFTIPIFWNLMQMRESFSWKQVVPIVICYLFIYFMENRSTLFPITLIISYVFLFASNSKLKPLLVILFVIVGGYIAIQTQDVWLSLFEETSTQVSNNEYARNVEIAYFLSSDANPGILTYFLGNGLVSRHGNAWVENLFDLGIFNSDVGFIGFWNLYGLIPVMVFIYTMIYAIIKKRIPYYLKLWAIQMLACSLTISYFASQIPMMYYSFFFYLLYLNKEKLCNEY